MIAALYVETAGCYFGLSNVDPWDQTRDARLYDGPYPCIGHPPCQRWGRYWSGGPSAKVRRSLGDDEGCFAAALGSVRQWGGVIEHPEASHAWRVFNLRVPDFNGGWSIADDLGGYTCCVSQGHYGHDARKMTWLYVFGTPFHELPALRWGPSFDKLQMEDGYHSAAERKAGGRSRRNNGSIENRLGHKARLRTPLHFRDLLISIPVWRSAAKGACGGGEMIFSGEIKTAFVTQIFPLRRAELRRKADGYHMTRACGSEDAGWLFYGPDVFPLTREGLDLALFYAQGWCDQWGEYDPDPRPRLIQTPTFGRCGVPA